MSENEEAPINGHELKKSDVPSLEASPAPAEETPKKRVRWSLFKVDGDWPPDGVVTVDVEIPRPAVFSRAYAIRTGLAGLDGKPQAKLRMVFVCCPDAAPMPVRMLIMDHVSAIGVEEGKPMPEYLDTVIHPSSGEPVGLWRVPAAVDEVLEDAETCASPDA